MSRSKITSFIQSALPVFRSVRRPAATTTRNLTMRVPTVFVNHGGGPMPVLGQQPGVVQSLKKIAELLPKPEAIIVVSAHYRDSPVGVMTAEKPGMYYDYSGFSPEAYQLKYDAPGNPQLARRIGELLKENGIQHKEDSDRDYDHGMFIPLMLMYPDASIPVVGISVPANDELLWRIGETLKPLREEGCLVLGSGASFHSFPAFFRKDPEKKKEDRAKAREWDRWLREAAQHSEPTERKNRLLQWTKAPHALFAHPTPEHFAPLLVVAAAAGDDVGTAIDPPSEGGLAASQFSYGL